LTNYVIDINEILKNDLDENKKIGIWAKIKNLKTGEILNKHIWWKDREGIIHDGTLDLPVKLRDLVDNAWLEFSRN
jgi:hypothetical protein